MAWLVNDARVMASAELAESRVERRRGLLGRDELEGALVLRPCRWVHTIGMRFPIDVAYCDVTMKVLEVVSMQPHRVGRPRLAARAVIEAEAGSFHRWGVEPGMTLEVKA